MAEGFIPLAEAAKRASVSRVTFMRLIQRGAITTYNNPADRRSQLVRVDDLNNYITPKPEPPRRATPRERQGAAAESA